MGKSEVKGVEEEKPQGLPKPNQAAGEIRTDKNKRAVVITGDLWKAITEAMARRLSAELDDVLYSAGLTWGGQAYADFAEGISSAQKTIYHTRNMGLSEFKERFNNSLVEHGWGRFDIYQKYELIFIDLFSSAFPEMVETGHAMTCSLMAGFFAGFFTELIGVDLSCIELRCAAVGADKCTFLVADSAITGSVRKWLSKGRGFDDIVAAIGEKEYQGKK